MLTIASIFVLLVVGSGLLWFWNMRRVYRKERRAHEAADRQIERQALERERQDLSTQLKELENEERLHQAVPDTVQELATLLDPQAIRRQLLESIHRTLRHGAIHLYAGSRARDAADAWVMEKRVSLCVPDTRDDARFNAIHASQEVRSLLIVPLIVDQEWFGLVRLTGFVPQLFSSADLRIVETLVDLASEALGHLSRVEAARGCRLRDGLTQSYAQPFLAKIVQRELLRVSRFNEQGGLLFIRGQAWTALEKTYGRLAMDEVRIQMANRLESLRRPSERISVFGPHDVWIWVPDVSPDALGKRLRQLKKAFGRFSYAFGADKKMVEWIPLTWTSVHFPEQATSVSQILRLGSVQEEAA